MPCPCCIRHCLLGSAFCAPASQCHTWWATSLTVLTATSLYASKVEVEYAGIHCIGHGSVLNHGSVFSAPFSVRLYRSATVLLHLSRKAVIVRALAGLKFLRQVRAIAHALMPQLSRTYYLP